MSDPDLARLDTDALWDKWSTSPEVSIKDELVIRYIPLVEQVAGRLRMGLPNSVEMNELVNSGVIGLISAIDNYVLEKGFKFETYAVPRIRGSILDSLRDYDWMPRSIRTKTRMLETALSKLESELGRIPADEEVANELQMDLDDYFNLIDEVKIASILSLDQTYATSDGESSTLVEMLEDEDAIDMSEHLEWQEAKDIAKRLIASLSQQERLVIALYYYEELTLREVGEVLSISESRVSQIHSKIMLTLKAKLRDLFAQNTD